MSIYEWITKYVRQSEAMEANFVYFLVPMATLFDSDGIIHHNFNDDHQCIIFTHTHTQNDFFKMILIGFFILALSPSKVG